MRGLTGKGVRAMGFWRCKRVNTDGSVEICFWWDCVWRQLGWLGVGMEYGTGRGKLSKWDDVHYGIDIN